MSRCLAPLPALAAIVMVACSAPEEASLPAAAPPSEAAAPVSFHRDVMPVLRANCVGCHRPGKKEGNLLMTTFAAVKAGGKKGAGFVAEKPEKSAIVKMISGEKPEMPKDGAPLKPEEIALIERWIAEGAKNDTPPPPPAPSADHPPVYRAAPGITSLAWSPDGSLLAVAGYHEVLLHKPDGSGLVARLVGEAPHVQALAFSADGKWLAVSGGQPTEFGSVQIWDVANRSLHKSYRVSTDTLYGVSFSPDATQVAVGGADKSVRVLAVADGKELMKFDGHSDWVLGTTFTQNGRRLLSGGRDRAMKLIGIENAQLIDDINKLLEPVLCLARHPKEDQALYGGGLGTPRIYKISDNQGRTAANNDTNLIKELERQPGPVRAVAWSADAETVVVAADAREVGRSEVRIYRVKDGARVATLEGHAGAVFAAAFHPDPKFRQVWTGGFDGKARLFDAANGQLLAEIVPFPVTVAGR